MSGFAVALSLAVAAGHALAGPAARAASAWFLAGVFMWSGVAKLRRPALSAMAMVDFGVLRRVRPWLGAALGATEVTLAGALALAAALLWLFALLIARSLAAGRDFACFCFGEAEGRLSRWTLARTAALALLATAAAVPPWHPGGPRQAAGALPAIAGSALLGTIALASYIPRLLRWNTEPVMIRPAVHIEVR